MILGLGRGGKRALAVVTVVGGALLALAGVAVGSTNLSLVAYSTPQDAYEALIPAFQHTPAGKGSPSASRTEPPAIRAAPSPTAFPPTSWRSRSQPDIDRLVQTGQVATTWNQDAFKGMVTRSVVVFTVRKGNPKKIKTWTDLLKPGVDVLDPELADLRRREVGRHRRLRGDRKAGGSDDQAKQYLRDLYKHVSVQDKSAREALQTFASGKGDVLIGYENEAIYAQQHGIPVDYVIPKNTILIENPIAAVQTSSHLTTAKAFVTFAHTPQAQALFASKGYRPVLPALANSKKIKKAFPRPKGLFTINSLGGWNSVNRIFFDPANGVVPKAQRGQ